MELTNVTVRGGLVVTFADQLFVVQSAMNIVVYGMPGAMLKRSTVLQELQSFSITPPTQPPNRKITTLQVSELIYFVCCVSLRHFNILLINRPFHDETDRI